MTIRKILRAPRRRYAVGVVAALAAGVLAVSPLASGPVAAIVPPDAGPPDGVTAAAPTGTVTLVTGDRVTVHGDGQVSAIPHPDRADRPLVTYHRDGHVHVVPPDAAPLLAAGRLDPRLFDVTALISSGLSDPDRAALPLIITEAAGSAGGVLDDTRVHVTRELPAVAGLAVTVEKAGAGTFWRGFTAAANPDAAPGVTGTDATGTGLWLDATLRVALADSVPQVRAPQAWTAGYDGTGTTVAVLDTGIDVSHPDLAGKVVDRANFTGEQSADLHGHGTHVAATVAGTGAASGGSHTGVAPGASLLDGKVCDAEGDCQTSAIIDGMQWAAEQGADVVNISIGGPDTPGVDPLEAAVDALTASHGSLFVIAAGNNGGARTVNSPASADAALAVGAVDGSDAIAGFSSRGPRAGDAALKPEITAPGVGIESARSADSGLPGEAYAELSGTSMAAPHVAGAAAILTQRRPDWPPEVRKAALVGSATPDPALHTFTQGGGRLDVAAAAEQLVTAEPAAVSLGFVESGEGDTLTRSITYHNHGTSELTLTVGVDALGPGGTPPAGVFTLDSDTVTVPAQGEATVTLTAAVGLPGPAGIYSGWLTASAGDTLVRTPIGFERAVPLTFEHIGRTGGAPITYTTFIMRVDGTEQFILSGEPGPVTVWAPGGTYLVMSTILDVGPDGEQSTVLAVPRLIADGPQEFQLDARQAQPVEINVPDAAAELWAMELGFEVQPGAGPGFSITSAVRSGTAFLGSVSNGPVAGFRTKITSDLIVPGPAGDEHDAPLAYHLGWFVEDQVPTGFAPEVDAGDLATVTARHAGHIADGLGYKSAVAQPADHPFASGITFGLPFGLPSDRTERYQTGDGLRWVTRFSEHATTSNAHVVTTHSAPIAYAGGSTQEQWWNRPVYWPTFAAPVTPLDWVSRAGDQIRLFLPLFGDGDGHAGRPDAATVAGEVRLTRDAEVIYEGPYEPEFGRVVDVPAAAGTYQLEVSAQREGAVVLGTATSTVWTFQSSSVPEDVPTRQPLWTVQLTPPLDAAGSVPAGATIAIPALARPQPGSAAGALTDLAVDFSVDDGATWQPATVSAVPGGGHSVELNHPDLPGFVSLRARAVDAAGNAVEQEVIRAYRIS